MKTFEDLINEKFLIETERLKIYPFYLNTTILNDFHEIYSDVENSKGFCVPHLNGNLAFNSYFKDKYFKFQVSDKCVLMLVIQNKDDGKIIGVRNLIYDNKYILKQHTNEYNKVVTFQEIYFNPTQNIISEIAINKKYWNKGYAYEASDAIFAFLKNYKIKNILIFINPENKKAEYIAKKIGFKETNYGEILDDYNFFEECLNHSFNYRIDNYFILNY